mmetsp:Transcript_10736/g.12449  ORF Transcript_10736/g.12449 Transcript_10736/m.12449 type:complete len:108 (-) Transcript_10736:275-598(-)
MQRECRGQERVPLRKLCREIHPEKTNNQIETSIKVHLRTYRPLIKPERTPKSFKRAKVGEETGQQGRRKNESNFNKKHNTIYNPEEYRRKVEKLGIEKRRLITTRQK